MNTYWLMEYVKIFIGYFFFMFVWPSVVFGNYLKGKTKTYRFSFCVTAQILIVNTIVLLLGLFGILHTRLVAVIFYGIFFGAFLRMCSGSVLLKADRERKREILRVWMQELWKGFSARSGEYILLSAVLVFGMMYFSYGAFQIHSYSIYDVYQHHGWVNALVEGNIYPGGIYPEAMHCFIYCLYAMFGIRIYSMMLFLQCIHLMLFFLSAYILLREVFHWRYSPIFVLLIYMMIDLAGGRGHSIYRLPITLPMEFGLHTQFLCAAFFIRYMKYAGHVVRKEKKSRFCWDENLLLLLLALAASIASHYFTTIMAFLICTSFAVFYIRKIFRVEYFVPLFVSVVCGCMIAVVPMAGALFSGIPFEGSIRWALSEMESSNAGRMSHESVQSGVESVRGPLDLTQEDLEVVEKLPYVGQRLLSGIIKTEYFIKVMYEDGYQGMFKPERGRRIFWVTVCMILFCVANRVKDAARLKGIGKAYPPIILLSFLSVFFCVTILEPGLGFPVLLPEHRFCAEGFLMNFAVMMMPADILFSVAAQFRKDYILQGLSYLFAIGIYGLMHFQDNFHSYLSCSLNRYDAAVEVTEAIISEYPEGTYTVISPHEEIHQLALYGEHEEIPVFLEKCMGKQYSLATEYVFIYVEKRPIEYHQVYYYNGPSWLGKSGDTQIKATEISEEAAEENLEDYAGAAWEPYAEGRTAMESKAYQWCQNFAKLHPSELKIYYEDDNFVCYYFKQDTEEPYNLAGGLG